MIASAVKAFGNLSKPSELNYFRVRFRFPLASLASAFTLSLCNLRAKRKRHFMVTHFDKIGKERGKFGSKR